MEIENLKNELAARNSEIIQLKKKIAELEAQFIDNTTPGIEIYQHYEYWIIVKQRKSKKSNTLTTETHKVTTNSVDVLLKIIIEMSKKHKHGIKSRDVWKEIMKIYLIEKDLESFNGGKNRSPIYFPLFYYPAKVLEKQGIIEHTGGGIVRLLNKEVVSPKPQINMISDLFT